MIPLIDLHKQHESIQDEINPIVQEVISSTAFIQGKFVNEFESHFGAKHGATHTIGCSNGTSSLHLALLATGIRAGDEVITTTNTFIATAEAIHHVGAKPILVDIDPKTYNIDVTKIAAAITPKTKAIIPVHIYGNPVDMTAVLAIAKQHNLVVIEDCAQAHLAQYNNQFVGTFGEVGSFSFYPGKNLGAYGDAGAVITQSSTLASKMRMLADHGRSEKYLHQIIGYNYRLDALQAAILNVKLRHLNHWTQLRRQHAALYNELLSNEVDIQLPLEQKNGQHVYHIFAIQLRDRNWIADRLKTKGIATGIHYPVPLHLQPALSALGYKKGDFPIAESVSQNILSLPIYPEMSEDDVKFVAQELKTALTERPNVS